MEIEEINKEIARLTKLRKQHFDEQLADKKKEFFTLKWLDNKSLYYHYGNHVFSGYFPEEYQNIFNYNKVLLLYGNSNLSNNNILIRRSSDMDSLLSFEIFTENPNILIEFINKYNLKISLPYNFKKLCTLYNTLLEHGA